MKPLLLSAFTDRRRLISSGHSKLPETWTQKEMQRIEYYLATGNALNIARKNSSVLRVLLPWNFIKKFNELLKGTK